MKIDFSPSEYRELENIFQNDYLKAVKLVVSLRGVNPNIVILAPDRTGFHVPDPPATETPNDKP